MTSTKPKIIVSGANGQLAKEIKFLSNKNEDYIFHFFDKKGLDITNEIEVAAIFKEYKPGLFINCAAYTAVDKAENEAERAIEINTKGSKLIAQECKKNNCLLIHISSDYVYDNEIRNPLKETDPNHPKSIYAKSKYDGENEIIETWEKSVIIRSSWIYSSYGNNFVKTMNKLLLEKSELKIVDDQIGTPTYGRDLADVIINNVAKTLFQRSDNNKYGIYNFTNAGVTNWYLFAQEIKKINGSKCKITPISTKEFNALAPRPLYSVLDTLKIRNTFAIDDIPHWKDSLSTCMSELNN